MKTKVKTKYSYRDSDNDYSVSSYSETVPDHNLSVREILMRFSRGLPPPGIGRDGLYDEETEQGNETYFEVHPSIKQDQDLTDIETIKDEFKSRASSFIGKVVKGKSKGAKKDPEAKPTED